MMNGKSYSEMLRYSSLEDRLKYLKLDGIVCNDTFGYYRYLNQVLYKSAEWKKTRRLVIIRDNGCDLACTGYDIFDKILIHHINPITIEDIVDRNPIIFDLDNLVTTTYQTHNVIHYSSDIPVSIPIERTKNDTSPWKH